MTSDCIAKQFGCSCGTECKSATARLAEINQKIATIQAKRNAHTAMMMAGVACAFGLVAFSFIGLNGGVIQ